MHPNWSIETDVVYQDDKRAIVKATIRNENGVVMAQAHKDGLASAFREFLTKAETGAVGRALGLVGCGTQFCTQDLSEEPDETDPAAKDPKHYPGVDSGLDRPKTAVKNSPAAERQFLIFEVSAITDKKKLDKEMMRSYVEKNFFGKKLTDLTVPELQRLVEEMKRL
jgi:hypothetical protein